MRRRGGRETVCEEELGVWWRGLSKGAWSELWEEAAVQFR